ncbi:MAG TPA: hypothetical protein VF495_09390 [Phenylobacterium sp.]
MRKTTLILAATTALSLGAGAASAQVWMPMIERQGVLDDRIEAARDAGEINSAQARMMRADMSALVALEASYRYGGLSSREKLDLDRRFALLDDQVRLAVRPVDSERWTSIEERKLALDARIDAGLRSGELTAGEAANLRDDFDDIARVEASYRIDGLSPSERADLNRRFDELSARIRVARADDDRARY